MALKTLIFSPIDGQSNFILFCLKYIFFQFSVCHFCPSFLGYLLNFIFSFQAQNVCVEQTIFITGVNYFCVVKIWSLIFLQFASTDLLSLISVLCTLIYFVQPLKK